MTVVTDKRTYFFDLVASPTRSRFTCCVSPMASGRVGGGSGRVSADCFRPGCFGPDREDPRWRSRCQRRRPQSQSLFVAAAGDGVNDPAMLNFSWRKKGAKSLAPLRIYDDGLATYLLWGDEQDIPQICVAQTAWQLANFAIRGNTIVISGAVPELIVLRGGRVSATLENMRGKVANPGATLAAPTTVAVSSTATPPN